MVAETSELGGSPIDPFSGIELDCLNPSWRNWTAVGTLDRMTAAELVEKGGLPAIVDTVPLHGWDAHSPLGCAGDSYLKGRNNPT